MGMLGFDRKSIRKNIRDVLASVHIKETGKLISAKSVLAKTKAAFEMPVFAPVAA